jgi:glycosyltransferase involved in cell wall biosynthesis
MSLLLSLDGQKRNIKKPAVLHIVPNGDVKIGGVEYASIRLAHEQAKSGLGTCIIEVNGFGREQYSWRSERVKYIDPKGIYGYFKKFQLTRKFLLQHRPLVHFHGVWDPKYIPFFLLIIITKTIFIVSPHGSFEAGALRQSFLKKFLFRKLFLDFVLRKATDFWACSQKEYNSIRLEFPEASIAIVPIGIDMPAELAYSCIKGKFAEPKTILVISRLAPGKGLLNLVKAWNLIRDDKWRIIIAGPDSNNYKKIIEKEISNLDLNRFFSFTGYVDSHQRDGLYCNADFFVLPSLSENFGIVVAEALSYGLPVLTTNETPWGYVGLERGCLCVDTDHMSLASGLKVLMNLNKNERASLFLAARSFVDKEFSWKSVVNISKRRTLEINHLK